MDSSAARSLLLSRDIRSLSTNEKIKLLCVENGASLRIAAKVMGLPKSTVADRVSRMSRDLPVRPRLATEKEENDICWWIESEAAKNNPPTPTELKKHVRQKYIVFLSCLIIPTAGCSYCW